MNKKWKVPKLRCRFCSLHYIRWDPNEITNKIRKYNWKLLLSSHIKTSMNCKWLSSAILGQWHGFITVFYCFQIYQQHQNTIKQMASFIWQIPISSHSQHSYSQKRWWWDEDEGINIWHYYHVPSLPTIHTRHTKEINERKKRLTRKAQFYSQN